MISSSNRKARDFPSIKRSTRLSPPQKISREAQIPHHRLPSYTQYSAGLTTRGTVEYFIPSAKYVEQNAPTRRSYARHDTYRGIISVGGIRGRIMRINSLHFLRRVASRDPREIFILVATLLLSKYARRMDPDEKGEVGLARSWSFEIETRVFVYWRDC